MPTPPIILKHIAAIAQQASTHILEFYTAPNFLYNVNATKKADHSPVTDADLAADAIIYNGLAKLEPAFAILTEERADEWPRGNQPSTFWCVDPLDGTKGFLNRTDDFAVCIGLVHNGVAVAGVIAEPVTGYVWVGNLLPELGDVGSWKLGETGRWKAIRVREQEPIPTVVASRNHENPAEKVWLAKHYGIYDAQRFGSAVKFAWVAEGRADAYLRLGPTSWWDVAAGDALIRAAGGTVVGPGKGGLTYTGESFRVPGFLCAGKGGENLSI